MARVSNWNKFVLLLWKNWKIQWNAKCGLATSILVPVCLCLILLLDRYFLPITSIAACKYDTVHSLNSLKVFHEQIADTNKPNNSIYFSPRNDFLENIVKEAAQTLGISDFKSFEDAKTLEVEGNYQNPFAGIQFDEAYADITELPTSLNFALRFPYHLRSGSILSWQTNTLFSLLPSTIDDEKLPLYLSEGFLQLQNAVSMAYMRQKSNKDDLPEVVVQRYPYPAYNFDVLGILLPMILPTFIVFGFMYPSSVLIKKIVTEKEFKLKEIMILQGLSNWLHWIAWFTISFIIFCISVVFVVIIFKIPLKGASILDHSSFTTLLFFFIVYIIANICFCFMLASIFTKSSIAAIFGALFMFLSHIPYLLQFLAIKDNSISKNLCLCLLQNTAMGIGIHAIVELERLDEGLQWRNIIEPVWIDNSVTVGHVILMMLVSSVIYIIICLYLEQIVPREYGVPRKWYFPFTRQFWCRQRKQAADEGNLNNELERRDSSAFEAEPENKKIGVQVKKLKKKFGHKTAVNDLSLNMFESEITVLLGHNEAGKTTLILMLTGIYSPTSGTATINGRDIRTDMEGSRESLGICPQHDILFANLSVSNHIRFYCRAKGLKGTAVENEVTKYLDKIGLTSKAQKRSVTLSGGMKRRLSLCCALCGDTKVVFCDEPSSGLDPSSRRQLWDLLVQEKNGRTILLSTHFMDEADVLGDRIAIMCGGEIKCCGTSFFLKKQFGSGYKLICEKGANCQTTEVTALLRKYIPDITPESDIGSELSYILSDKYSDRFENMLSALEDHLKQLNLNGYGIGITSLEDVFMKVGAEKVSSAKEKDKDRISGGTKDNESLPRDGINSETERLLQGKKLCLNQLRAMLLKNILNTWHNKIVAFLIILLPVFILFIFTMFAKTANEESQITISRSQYSAVVTVLERSADIEKESNISEIADQYEDLAKSQGKFESTGSKHFSEYILDLSTSRFEQNRIDKRYLTSATFQKNKIIAWLNNEALHTGPLTVNVVHNAMAKVFIGKDSQISVSNWPLPEKESGLKSEESSMTDLTSSFCITVSLFIIFLIRERIMRAKLIQFLSGVSKFIFWMSHFVWDLTIFTLSALLVIFYIFCSQMDYELGKTFLILMIFGCSALLFTYLFSLLFPTPASGFICIFFLNFIVANIVFTLVKDLKDNIGDMTNKENVLSWILRFVPVFALIMSLHKVEQNDNIHTTCRELENVFPGLQCEIDPQCCELIPFLGWAYPGILFEVVCMLITCIVCTFIIFLYEFHFFMRYCKSSPPKQSGDMQYDEDVEQERKRVSEMNSDEVASKNLVVDRLTKTYSKLLAVNQLSICVPEGECFGLLGVNGAGKTTAFNMMVGDSRISYGNVYVQGLSVRTKLSKVYKKIGYCPQFDALFMGFTGRQLLKIFCLVRGVQPTQVKKMLEELANSLGFRKHLDKKAMAYSGGNRRKLSTAIAVIGSPAVIYLDEPTTGMDPASRRQLWNVICKLRDAGNSIVLTTHNMDECEALCTRIAIMVNGELKCIGSKQHLKNKFSRGLILKIKVRMDKDNRKPQSSSSMNRAANLDDLTSDEREFAPTPVAHVNSSMDTQPEPSTTNESVEPESNYLHIERVKEFVHRNFPESTLQDEFYGTLTYYIPLAGLKWSKIFGIFERNRRNLNIEDYSITQTTLDEIFLNIVKAQKTNESMESNKKQPKPAKKK